MKIACHILSYNVDLFIDHVLENSAPHVDKIYITYSVLPWGYNKSARATKTNPTTLARVESAIARLRAVTGLTTPIEIIEGEWTTEDETRNMCLDRARLEGFDWLVIQDADEFYTEESWNFVKTAMIEDDHSECIQTTWYMFWKSSHFIIQHRNGNIKDNNVCFALRCNSGKRFVGSRATNAQRITLIDATCYHYSYVMSDAEMVEKVTTWGHAHQFDSQAWLKHKWFNWTPNTQNLNPVNPVSWKRVIRFPNEQPLFSRHFALPLKPAGTLGLADTLGNLGWDLRGELVHSARAIKRTLLG